VYTNEGISFVDKMPHADSGILTNIL